MTTIEVIVVFAAAYVVVGIAEARYGKHLPRESHYTWADNLPIVLLWPLFLLR